MDAIPSFDFSSLDFSSTATIPQLPFDPLTSFPLPSFDAAVGITPTPTARPLPPVPQTVFHQAPSIASSHKAPEDVAPGRSNVLSSILINSGVPSKRSSVRSTHMKGPKSTLGKRSERDEAKEATNQFLCQARRLPSVESFSHHTLFYLPLVDHIPKNRPHSHLTLLPMSQQQHSRFPIPHLALSFLRYWTHPYPYPISSLMVHFTILNQSNSPARMARTPHPVISTSQRE